MELFTNVKIPHFVEHFEIMISNKILFRLTKMIRHMDGIIQMYCYYLNIFEHFEVMTSKT